MTDSRHPPSPASAREQALHWFSRARLGALTPDERRAFEAWRAQDPEHERQYRSLETVWRAADLLPEDEMRAILAHGEPGMPPRRRWLLAGAGAACAAAAVAAVAGRQWWAPMPAYARRLATAPGERRQFELPDGTLLDLNTASLARVAYYGDRRTVELAAGEALFAVRPDPARPFLVDAGDGRVRVTGTRFDVRRDPERVTVAVAEGSVEFSAGPWWRRRTARLTAGQVSQASPQAGLVPPYRDRVEAMLAWQRGRLVFQDTPLSQVAAELSRYLARPLRLADAGVGGIRVSGTLAIDAPEAALDLLPDIAPVAVLRRADGSALLAPR